MFWKIVVLYEIYSKKLQWPNTFCTSLYIYIFTSIAGKRERQHSIVEIVTLLINSQIYLTEIDTNLKSTILMQFVLIVGFDWLVFSVKFSIYKSELRCSVGRFCHLENVITCYRSLPFLKTVFIWRHVVHVPKSSTTFRRILIYMIFRPMDMQE